MEIDGAIPPDANMIIFPGEPTSGALGVFAKYEKTSEIKELELERKDRVWEVRATISDHIPLAGDAEAALTRPANHLFQLNENPLWRGGPRFRPVLAKRGGESTF